MLSLYVTSSHRKCGKTFISTGLAATMQSLGYNTSIYKPIQTCGIEKNGFTQSPDLTYVKTIDPYINTVFSYLYKSDSEPLIASESENKPIELEYILNEYKKISAISECTILDGDCGILSPIAANLCNIDLVHRLKLPILIVTKPDYDSINNTLLTINSATEKKLEVRGVVINNIMPNCNRTLLNSIPRIIEEYTNIKVLGLVENLGQKPTPQDLITTILNGIDIESVFNIKIEKLDFD